MIRIAIAGYGFIGRYHAKAVLASKYATLVGIWTRSEKNILDFRKLVPDGIVFSSAEEMARSDKIDAVVIALPNSLHYPVSKLCMENQKHVLVEKPMAMNSDEAEKMVKLAKEKNVVLMVGHMWRFDVEVQAVKELVDSGKLGKIVKTKGYGIHVNWGPSGWFAKKEQAGGGALIDMGVHAIDTARFLLGDPEPVSLYAQIGTYYGDYDVDDTGVLVIKWSNSTVSIVESGWWQVHADGPEAATRLYGTNGYASLFPTYANIFKPNQDKWRPNFPPRQEHCDQSMYDRQMERFIHAILGKAEPFPSGEHGLTIMKIVDAAYRSSQANEVVKFV